MQILGREPTTSFRINERAQSGTSACDDIAHIALMSHGEQMSDLSTIGRLTGWARNLKRDVIALWLAARDPRVPWYAKALSAAVASYALSPIDLIPDFIPILGYLDDLLIVPFGIWAAVKLIPDPIMADLRAKAIKHRKPKSNAGLAAVGFIWLAAISLTIWFFLA
jgi:uncharacterized membrane protein YkvA (DUF1232 family)